MIFCLTNSPSFYCQFLPPAYRVWREFQIVCQQEGGGPGPLPSLVTGLVLRSGRGGGTTPPKKNSKNCLEKFPKMFFSKKIDFFGGTFLGGTRSQPGSAPEVNLEVHGKSTRKLTRKWTLRRGRLLRSRRRTVLFYILLKTFGSIGFVRGDFTRFI